MRRAFHHLRDYREGATAALHGARISRHIAHEGAEDANGFFTSTEHEGRGRKTVSEREKNKENYCLSLVLSFSPSLSSILLYPSQYYSRTQRKETNQTAQIKSEDNP